TRAKRKVYENENSTDPTNSAKQEDESNDWLATPTKRVRHSQTRAKNEETEHFIMRSVKCLVDGCIHSFSDTKALDAHLSESHNILHHRCLVAGCGESFSDKQVSVYLV